MIRPRPLRKGDAIGLIAPASPPDSPEAIQEGKEALERLGFRVILGKFISRRNRYLAGSDEERAEDFNEMFSNSENSAHRFPWRPFQPWK